MLLHLNWELFPFKRFQVGGGDEIVITPFYRWDEVRNKVLQLFFLFYLIFTSSYEIRSIVILLNIIFSPIIIQLLV